MKPKLDKNNLISFLFFMIPPSLVAGPFIAEIIFIMLSIFVFLDAYKKKNFKILNNIFVKIFLIYFLIVLFATISNYQLLKKAVDENLILKAFFLLRFVIYLFSVSYVIAKIELNKKFFYFLLFLLIILLLDSLFQGVFGINITGHKIINNRVSSFFYDELILGSFLQKIFPIILIFFVYFQVNLKKNNKKIILLIFVTLLIIFLAGNRSSYLLIALFIFLNFLFIRKLRKILFISTVIFLFFISFSTKLNLFHNSENLIKRIQVNSNHNFLHRGENKSNILFKYISKDYYGHYLIGKKMIGEKFFIGHGVKSFRYLCRGKLGNLYYVKGGVCSTHPHNYYLQAFIVGGVFAFLLLISIFLFSIIKLFKEFKLTYIKKNINHFKLCYILSCISVLVSFWPIIPTGNFHNNWIGMINFYTLGFLIGSRYLVKEKYDDN